MFFLSVFDCRSRDLNLLRGYAENPKYGDPTVLSPGGHLIFNMCWGSYHGPHKYDIPLEQIIDLVLKVNAECYSIEASNPRHDHEWRVWEKVKYCQCGA